MCENSVYLMSSNWLLQHLLTGIVLLLTEYVLSLPGGDVRLLLPGALHGKLPHHAGSCLSEIQEQPGQQTQEPLDTEAPKCS